VKSVGEAKEDGLLADNIAVGLLTLASPHGRITHGPVLHGFIPAGRLYWRSTKSLTQLVVAVPRLELMD
ncbi:hypothetical protein, partial [Mesorhizobium sp. M1D.F.Ca.ET.234.01.1.1]